MRVAVAGTPRGLRKLPDAALPVSRHVEGGPGWGAPPGWRSPGRARLARVDRAACASPEELQEVLLLHSAMKVEELMRMGD